MAKVTYRVARGVSVIYESETESRLELFLTTVWKYPLWILAYSMGREWLEKELFKLPRVVTRRIKTPE